MKKRLLSILLLCCMVLTLLPTAAFAEGSTEELPVCTCETACMAESMNDDCSVCGAEGASAENCAKYADSVNGEGSGTGTSRQALTNVAITFPTPEAGKPVGDGSAVSANADSGLTLYLFGPALWKQGEEPDKLDENAAYAEGNTYLLNFTFYTQKPITDETVLTYNGKPITRYADYQALTEALDAYDGKQDAYLGCVLFSAEGTGDPAMEDLKDLYLLSLYAFVRVPEAQIPEDTVDEQFSLTPGGTYYFDLSGVSIPGTANESLPDKTMRYVPFTYAGTVDAYKLTSAMATTEEYAQQNKYAHSLFVADYAVTHTVSWDDLNTKGLIFGKDYAAGGVGYTLRAPSCGSGFTDSGDSERGTPQSNEWDAVLNKNSGYIQNWNQMYSWGQDAYFGNASDPAVRGYYSARTWSLDSAAFSTPNVGFRPVLEILNPDALGSDGLKVVTLDLGGGTLGGSSDAIQIIVKTGSEFTAPASDGMTRPNGDTGSYFMWLGSNGKLYAPGASVPADVTKLTAQFALSEQFSLTPGGRYYFDLSAMKIPGTANGSLPDASLHYVPFTYAGTVDAYKLTTEMATTEEYAQKNKYPHSLFVADYAVTHTVSWDDLNTAGLIFGKDYAAGGVDYTLRAPSVGSGHTGSGDIERGTPQSNEWDAVLDKNSGYIKNWNGIYSWGQDTTIYNSPFRAVRGCFSARFLLDNYAMYSFPNVGFRPVLELPTDLAADNLKVVELRTVKFMPGEQQNWINIIVKNGKSFKAPAAEGLPRPDGISADAQLWWVDENSNFYKPGDTVPADVSALTALWGGFGLFLNRGDGEVEVTPDNYTDIFGDGTASFVLPKGKTLAELGKLGKLTGNDILGIYSTGRLEKYGCVFPNLKLKNADLTSVRLSEKYIGDENPLFVTLDGKNTVGSLNGIIESHNTLCVIGDGSLTLNSALTLGRYTQFGGGSVTMTDGLTAYDLTVDSGSLTVTGDPQAITLANQALGDLQMGDGVRLFTGSSAQDAAEAVIPQLSAEMQELYQRYLAGDNTLTYEELAALNNALRERFNAIFRQLPGKTYVRITGAWDVTYQPGTDGSGNAVTDIKFYNDALTLRGALFTRTGYTQVGWATVDGGEKVYAFGGGYTTNAALTLYPVWQTDTYTITYDLDRGTADDNPTGYTVETETFTLKNPTRPGYIFSGWSGTGLTGENNLTVTIPKGSTGNRSYTAHWRYNGGGGSGYSYYTIKATAGTGGSISPSGNVSVREGRDQTFTITPDKGYAVANVKIDGKSIGAVKSYTFENVRRTHTIEVIFMKANGNPQTGVFVDVTTGSYYEDAVDWAVENGITKGTDDTHFSPDGICTRAQAVTFLWRTAGSPKPETRAMPFTDVPVGSYYYDAVLWAVENGITMGTSDTTFSPNMTCSRAQIVAFLWRSEKSPAAGTANPFADVKSTAYYAGAVLWAVKENITKGTTSTTFSPDADCTRAQIVTFLWRCKK